jgi:hypothetical protein
MESAARHFVVDGGLALADGVSDSCSECIED